MSVLALTHPPPLLATTPIVEYSWLRGCTGMLGYSQLIPNLGLSQFHLGIKRPNLGPGPKGAHGPKWAHGPRWAQGPKWALGPSRPMGPIWSMCPLWSMGPLGPWAHLGPGPKYARLIPKSNWLSPRFGISWLYPSIPVQPLSRLYSTIGVVANKGGGIGGG